MFHYKHTKRKPQGVAFLGVFYAFGYGGLNHRLVTDYLFLSSHLQMRWLITPAITETIRDSNISIINTPFPYRYRGGNIRIIAYNQFSFYQFLFVPAQGCDVTTCSHHPDCREISRSPPIFHHLPYDQYQFCRVIPQYSSAAIWVHPLPFFPHFQ